MRKLVVLILFTISFCFLSYFGIEKFVMSAGGSQALKEAEQFISDEIVKEGGGTEPIPILNGQGVLITENGEQTFTKDDLAKALLNREDIDDFLMAANGRTGESNNGSTNSTNGQGEVGPNGETDGHYENGVWVSDSGSSGSGEGSNGSNGSNGNGGSNSSNGSNVSTDPNAQLPNLNNFGPVTMSNVLDYYNLAAQNVDFNALRQQAYGDYRIGQSIGVLYIPRLNRSLPIIYGADENELRYGVGFHTKTKLPGQSNQILLAGHRDTAFRDFGKMKIGDEFHVKTAKGTFVYTIFASQIVKANDTTVIQSTYPYEILTVSTCYPFVYLADAPERYVLYAR